MGEREGRFESSEEGVLEQGKLEDLLWPPPLREQGVRAIDKYICECIYECVCIYISIYMFVNMCLYIYTIYRT